MRPMLATATDRVPTGPGWAHEVKWDGMRVLAEVSGGTLRLTSRTERDVTVAFPELVGLAGLYEDLLLDGEIVVMQGGVPSFAALAERFHVTSAARAAALAARLPVTYLAFDLLRLYGVDLAARTFRDRRATLERLDLDGPHWRVPPVFTDGAALLDATREQGLEGVVSKRWDSRYAAGTRSPDWLKLPHRASVSVVIGGWRPESDQVHTLPQSRPDATSAPAVRLGAVLVGVPGVGGLRYLGRVGSGLAGRTAATLLSDLGPLTAAESPFSDQVPREDAAGTRWVHPVLVCEVQALGLTPAGRLRQPAFRGLRPDLTPGDVDVRELPTPAGQRGTAADA